jgi:penicillin-binding protein 1C
MQRLLKLKKWLKRILISSILLFVLFLILDFFIPLPMDEFKQRSFAQLVVDKDGHPLRAFPDSQGVWRYPVELDQVSPLYLQALINYEDRHFYRHFGVNPLAILRAFGQWVWHGELVSGASTLTMQVARIMRPHKKSFSGKIVQMFRALQLEWHYDKQEILEFYINYAPFGGPIEGVQAASFAYFGKTADDLSPAEAALLAVMPQSPSRFRPDRYPQRAQKARDKLLTRMHDFNVWQPELIDEAKQELVWAQYNTQPLIAPLLARRLSKENSKQEVIKSSLDINLQTQLESLVQNYIQTKPEKVSVAMMLVENKTMATRAYIGSADFLSQTRAGHVDMIQAIRSPGSTLKPFIYGMAIDDGIIHSESLLFDVPQSFNGYRPKNFTDAFIGPVSVSQALGRSLNMPAVQVLNEISPESFYAQMKNAGLDIKLPNKAKPNLSLALGGGGVSLEQLVAIFSSLGREGQASKINLQKGSKPKDYPLLSKGTAWIIQNILAQVPIKQIRSRHFSSSKQIAYKTGTSYGLRDAWALASNKKFTLGIWVGQADGSFLEKNTGRQSAVPLLQDVLAVLPNDWLQNPEQPFNVSQANICWPLGTKASVQDSIHCQKTRNATLLDDTAPPTINDPMSKGYSGGLLEIQLEKETGLRVLPHCWQKDVSLQKQVVWPLILDAWLAKPYRRESLVPKFHPDCSMHQSNNQLKIEGLHNNAIIYPEANTQNMPDVELKLEGSSGSVYWFINGIQQENQLKTLTLSSLSLGHYTVTAVDDSANYTELEFDVAF